jgi:hypothetical protein
MMRGRAGVLAALVALACGNLDRDVIVEKANRDGGVESDAGSSEPPEPDDAAPWPRHVAPIGCPQDGGCETIRCQPRECSRYCPYGCGGPFPTSPAMEPRSTTHSRPRTGVP